MWFPFGIDLCLSLGSLLAPKFSDLILFQTEVWDRFTKDLPINTLYFSWVWHNDVQTIINFEYEGSKDELTQVRWWTSVMWIIQSMWADWGHGERKSWCLKHQHCHNWRCKGSKKGHPQIQHSDSLHGMQKRLSWLQTSAKRERRSHWDANHIIPVHIFHIRSLAKMFGTSSKWELNQKKNWIKKICLNVQSRRSKYSDLTVVQKKIEKIKDGPLQIGNKNLYRISANV